jgi:hypothetical protein
VAARNWWRKLEVQYGDSTISHKAERCFRKHKVKDPKGKEGEQEQPYFKFKFSINFSKGKYKSTVSFDNYQTRHWYSWLFCVINGTVEDS